MLRLTLDSRQMAAWTPWEHCPTLYDATKQTPCNASVAQFSFRSLSFSPLRVSLGSVFCPFVLVLLQPSLVEPTRDYRWPARARWSSKIGHTLRMGGRTERINLLDSSIFLDG